MKKQRKTIKPVVSPAISPVRVESSFRAGLEIMSDVGIAEVKVVSRPSMRVVTVVRDVVDISEDAGGVVVDDVVKGIVVDSVEDVVSLKLSVVVLDVEVIVSVVEGVSVLDEVVSEEVVVKGSVLVVVPVVVEVVLTLIFSFGPLLKIDHSYSVGAEVSVTELVSDVELPTLSVPVILGNSTLVWQP